jgi:predicted nucleic acid-binding protein
VSSLVGAAIKQDSVPAQALRRARAEDVVAISSAVEDALLDVFKRPKFVRSMSVARRDHVLALVLDAAVRFEPSVRVTDCRDAKDNKYLELALAAPRWHNRRQRPRPARPAPLARCSYPAASGVPRTVNASRRRRR